MTAPSPIRPSPSGLLPRPTTPSLPEPEEENIPYPYSYVMIMASDSERAAVQAKFVAECNRYRWHHIYSIEKKVKK